MPQQNGAEGLCEDQQVFHSVVAALSDDTLVGPPKLRSDLNLAAPLSQYRLSFVAYHVPVGFLRLFSLSH